MNEIEITQRLGLDESKKLSLDMHSFMNILNIVTMELIHLGLLADDDQILSKAVDHTLQLAGDLRLPQTAYQRLAQVEDEVTFIREGIEHFCEQYPEIAQGLQAKESRENLESIFAILRQRTREMLDRQKDPAAWEDFEIGDLTERFLHVLNAIEKNAKGEYRIITNIAAQEQRDYYVDFKIESVHAPRLHMPSVFQDVFRDLIANARKYTPPGGRISAHIDDDGQRLVLFVEDNGCGIPAEELNNVVGYGVRGSNVARRRTMGGGYGLTKAYQACKDFGGRMWIASEEGKGTRLRIVLPSKPLG